MTDLHTRPCEGAGRGFVGTLSHSALTQLRPEANACHSPVFPLQTSGCVGVLGGGSSLSLHGDIQRYYFEVSRAVLCQASPPDAVLTFPCCYAAATAVSSPSLPLPLYGAFLPFILPEILRNCAGSSGSQKH